MTNELNDVPGISDKRIPPSGILPRNIQTIVLGGVAVVMVVVIWFSGRRTSPAHTSTGPTAQPVIQPPSEDRLIDYRRHIEEETRKLTQQQNDLLSQKSLLDKAVNQNVGGPSATTPNYGASASAVSGGIAEEKAKLEYSSLFASNIVRTVRPDPKAASSDTAPPPIQGLPPIDPRLYAALMLPPGSQPPQVATDNSTQNTKPVGQTLQTPKPSLPDLNRSTGKDYRLFEGTILETVLINRLDGTFSGPVDCLVSYDAYSHDHNHVLIPAGSHVLGDVHPVESGGQQRLAVTFHRLIMPDGFSVNLDEFHGLDQVGETGLRDQVNHHYLQMFGASIAIGLIAGLAQSNTQYGITTSASDAYRQGVATSLSQSSMHILDRFLNILPTFTIREGLRIKVYLQQDLALPSYENHEMSPDI
jgi:type IV secretory pathway VirB10-like protein